MTAGKRRVAASMIGSLVFAVVAIGLFYVYSRIPTTAAGGDLVGVLAWARPVKAGEAVAGSDVRVVKLPRPLAADLPDVARAGDERLLDGAWLLSDVHKGDFVRRGDLQPMAVPGPGPAGADSPDPGELIPLAGGRFVSATQTAVGGRFSDGPVTFPPTASAPGEGLGGVGMGKIAGPVAGAVMPDGAKRLYAFRREVPGGADDSAAYLVEMDLTRAEKFYKTRIPKTGYKLIGRSRNMRGNGVALVFAKGTEHYYFVDLHPTDRHGETKVVLVISRPRE